MWQAAVEHSCPLHRLSYAGTVQHINAAIPYLWLLAETEKALCLYRLLLEWVARDILPYRPDRIEPRVIKRRMKEYGLLNKPRHIMREQLVR